MIKIVLTDQRKIRAMIYALSMGVADLADIYQRAARDDKKQLGIAVASFQTAIVDLEKLIEDSNGN